MTGSASHAAVIAVLAGLGCSGSTEGPADASIADASIADAPLAQPDATPGPDATPAANPARLWLHGIGGSESNLELIADGPPNPF